MNKSEFTKVYADRLGVTIKEAENNLATFISTLTECLKNGEYVHVSGFATFELRNKQARDGVNPLNGEKVLIPACKSPNAKFSKTFKAIFND
ncbi:MAG: HU family DNA-binding protein [Clostridia bacterium]|nr:HU family DNA-binding protein [Clostridia bacterium]